MSMGPQPIKEIPQITVELARAAFPRGNPYMTLRDELDTIFEDDQFADLFPARGQPAIAPWQLALIMIMQFAEDLTDRQTAEQVRARIDWKYALGLELGEFCVSHLVDAFGRFLEAVTGGYHLESRASNQVKALENTVHARFRDEVLLVIGDVPGQLARRFLRLVQGYLDDVATNGLRDAIPELAWRRLLIG